MVPNTELMDHRLNQRTPSLVHFHRDFLSHYLAVAPWPLAIERTLECKIHSRQTYERPILDLGCGDGIFATILFADKIETGIDPNSRELKHARPLGAYEELLQCWGNNIPKPDNSYRTIFSNSVLEHIPDLPAVLREMYRLLAPGGRFYVTVPSDWFDDYAVPNQILQAIGLTALGQAYLRIANRFWNLFNLHSRETWEGVFKDAGFRVMDSWNYDPKWVCMMNGFLVPLSFPAYICKKLTNRWTWLSPVRRILFYPFAMGLEILLRGAERSSKGGLVFLALTKDA